jgi:exopolysaccharide biosynthesis protein
VDARGRLVIVEVDGRQDKVSQGLSIDALAHVMRSLGCVEAINLDGGGSSAAVVNGTLVSSPSDVVAGARVERKVAEAIVVVPGRSRQ